MRRRCRSCIGLYPKARGTRLCRLIHAWHWQANGGKAEPRFWSPDGAQVCRHCLQPCLMLLLYGKTVQQHVEQLKLTMLMCLPSSLSGHTCTYMYMLMLMSMGAMSALCIVRFLHYHYPERRPCITLLKLLSMM